VTTVAGVLNRVNTDPRTQTRWITGVINVVNGRKVTMVADNSGNAWITGLACDPTPPIGARVLLVATSCGNFIIGRIG
jgi:hypothetical protein